MADETIQEMRAVLNSLNPPRLEQGLESALRAMAEGINRIEGVTCRVFAAGDVPAFEDTAALNIYRVVQEACSNAVKHGNASDIDIDIKYEGSRCIFEIKVTAKAFTSVISSLVWVYRPWVTVSECWAAGLLYTVQLEREQE